jgi:hypothetical protein
VDEAENRELRRTVRALLEHVALLESRLTALESAWSLACERRRWPDELDRAAGETSTEPRR